jgi:hypothetical protein
MRGPAVVSLALALALVVGAAAQEPPDTPGTPDAPDDETRDDRKRELAARVARLRGRVLVQTPGEGGWTEVREAALLSAGDSVRAEDGAVELVLPGSEAAVRDLGSDGAERVVLAPDARVTVAPPGTDVRLRLDEGGCYAAGASADGLRVRAGDTTVTVRGGDAELELSRGGGVTVTVHSGSVDVAPSAGGRTAARSLSEGERLTVNSRGQPVVRPVSRPRAPDYVTDLDRVEPERVLFAELFREWPGTYHDAHPKAREREGHVLSTIRFPNELEPADPLDHRAEVRFGRSTLAKGTWTHAAGARVRVRYRLSIAAPVQLVVTCPLDGDTRQFESALVPARAGGWHELEFLPEHFKRNVGPPSDERIAPGGLITYFTLLAGHYEGPRPTVEVSRVLVYTGRR